MRNMTGMIMKLNPPGVFLKRWELLVILASIFLGVQLSYSGSRLDLMHVSEIANGPEMGVYAQKGHFQ